MLQLNLNATEIGSSSTTDAELRSKLPKGKVLAIDLEAALAEAAAQGLLKAVPVRRSKNGNLTVILPLKVAGNFFVAVDLDNGVSKKTTAEAKAASRKADLLAALASL